MKLNKFLLSAIAAASLTACSDSPEVVNNNKGQWNADGTGYVSLSISMPDNVTSKGSRANDQATNNDDFHYGTDNEYAVYNAKLIIFTAVKPTDNNKVPEDQYSFEAAYDMPINFETIGGDHNQIGSKGKLTQKINQIANNKDAKALIILNSSSDPDKGIVVDGTNLKIKGTEFSGTFAEFKKETAELTTDVTKGFTMTNAPLTNAKSSPSGIILPTSTSATCTTLADIDTNKIFPTADQANANVASTIYVERSVAKITVEKGPYADGSIELPGNTEYTIEVKGFALDNTNEQSYIVRNVDNTWTNLTSVGVTGTDDKYRFVGYTPIETGLNLYRTYWAKDPNYDGTTTGINLTHNTSTSLQFNNFGDLHPLYCLENTFDVLRQTKNNTTSVIVEAQIKEKNQAIASAYYMWNDDASTLTSDIETSAIAAANKLTAVKASGKTITNISFTTPVDGYEKIKSVTFAGETETTDGDLFNIIKNYFNKIAIYKDGKVYYTVLIKHFGDALTPWNKNEYGTTAPISSNNPSEIYPEYNGDRNNNYLGRYGVVRNNWYNLTLNNIKRIGKPEIDNPDTPDDELNSYISVSINILSWAKRQQDVDLQ